MIIDGFEAAADCTDGREQTLPQRPQDWLEGCAACAQSVPRRSAHAAEARTHGTETVFPQPDKAAGNALAGAAERADHALEAATHAAAERRHAVAHEIECKDEGEEEEVADRAEYLHVRRRAGGVELVQHLHRGTRPSDRQTIRQSDRQTARPPDGQAHALSSRTGWSLLGSTLFSVAYIAWRGRVDHDCGEQCERGEHCGPRVGTDQ